MKRQIPLVILIATMIITGSLNIISDKFQNEQTVYEGGVKKYFYHPYMQALLTFFSISLAYPFCQLLNRNRKNQRLISDQSQNQQLIKPKFEKRALLVYILASITAVTFDGIALNFVPASAYQMIRGGSIAATFLFSVIYLKMKVKLNHIVGSGLAVLGVIAVGLAHILFSPQEQQDQSTLQEIIGLILIISALFLNGFCSCNEQSMLRKYDIDPLKLVGYGGFYCFLIYLLVLIPIFTFIPCSFGANACVISDSGDSYFERPGIYLRELFENIPVLTTTIAEIFSILIFNICAISITDRINALAKQVCDVMSTALIWLAAYVVTVTAGENDENYRWESTDGRVIGLQMVGFVVLVLGNLIYNQIIPLKFVNNSQKSKDETLFQTSEQKTSENLI